MYSFISVDMDFSFGSNREDRFLNIILKFLIDLLQINWAAYPFYHHKMVISNFQPSFHFFPLFMFPTYVWNVLIFLLSIFSQQKNSLSVFLKSKWQIKCFECHFSIFLFDFKKLMKSNEFREISFDSSWSQSQTMFIRYPSIRTFLANRKCLRIISNNLLIDWIKL